MKIGMILDSVYPDDARITNQCDELIKKNHEIHLFCLSFNRVFIENEVINKINIHRYYCSKITYKLSITFIWKTEVVVLRYFIMYGF